jgi:hypothetical protein
MTSFKFHLLAAAAVVSAFGAGSAQAQFAYSPTVIRGAGASLPAVALRQTLDCYGVKTPLAFSGAASATNPLTIADGNYANAAAATLGSRFGCADPVGAAGSLTNRVVQKDVDARYISTGSGAGRTAWVSHASPAVTFPAGWVDASYPYGVQFAFSDDPAAASLLTSYNTTVLSATTDPNGAAVGAGTAASRYGAPIQIPIFVAPVTFAYDPIYAREVQLVGGVNTVVSFKYKIPVARADGSGGMRLTKAQYCAIFNGVITNFNQLPATVVDKDPLDTAPFNVPIKLVGRSETSGTSVLFTRALAAQCTGPNNTTLNVTFRDGTVHPIPNKFVNAENLLPRSGAVTIAGTGYTGASTISPTNSISGAFFDKATSTITIGAEAPGLFTVANGNDGVALAIHVQDQPNIAILGDRKQNGRWGYVGPDYTLPAAAYTGATPGFGLFTASLQIGTGTTYADPSPANASAAYGTLQPPQSKGTAGAYDAAGVGDRANPLNWVQLADKSVPLANPVKGYPVVGSSNALLYTCYFDQASRRAVVGAFANMVGKVTKDDLNQAMPAKLATDPKFGTFALNGLAPLPAGWQTAINETFFKNSTQVGIVGDPTSKLGLRNLWIQSKLPTSNTGAGLETANPSCTGKIGS